VGGRSNIDHITSICRWTRELIEPSFWQQTSKVFPSFFGFVYEGGKQQHSIYVRTCTLDRESIPVSAALDPRRLDSNRQYLRLYLASSYFLLHRGQVCHRDACGLSIPLPPPCASPTPHALHAHPPRRQISGVLRTSTTTTFPPTRLAPTSLAAPPTCQLNETPAGTHTSRLFYSSFDISTPSPPTNLSHHRNCGSNTCRPLRTRRQATSTPNNNNTTKTCPPAR
jgi:hypothetical protein